MKDDELLNYLIASGEIDDLIENNTDFTDEDENTPINNEE